MNNKTGLSLVSLQNRMEVEELSQSYNEKKGSYPNFELSYRMDTQFISDLSFIKGRVLSGHAPCPGGEYLPNLGSRDKSVISESLDSIAKSADTVASFRGSILVLHAGYTLDGPVFTEYKKRKKVLEEYEKQSSYLWLKKGSICKPGYADSDEYRTHMEVTLGNLKQAAGICRSKGVKLAVENLNPRLTYLFQMPEDFIVMAGEIGDLSICIDIGHLWISSLVHGFNYFDALELLVSTERVVSVHVHDNRSIGGSSPYYNDDHGTIGTGRVPVKGSVLYLTKHSSSNLIIETASAPLKNIQMLDSMVTP